MPALLERYFSKMIGKFLLFNGSPDPLFILVLVFFSILLIIAVSKKKKFASTSPVGKWVLSTLGIVCNFLFYQQGHFVECMENSPDWNTFSPIQEIPPIHSPERGEVAPHNPVPAAPPAPPAAPVPPAAPQDIDPQIQNTKGKIYFNLTTLYGSMDPRQATELTDIIFDKKEKILGELRRLDNHSPVNNQILWQDGGDTIRDPQSGGEYHPQMLDMILGSLQKYGRGSDHYKKFLNDRIDTLQNDDLINLELEDLPMDKLNELNQAKFVRGLGEG